MTEHILSVTDSILFLCIGLSSIYLLVFALPSMFKRTEKYPKAKKRHRYALLLPTGTARPELDYPEELYDIYFYKGLHEAVQALDGTKYDMAIVLGERSRPSSSMLQEVNKMYDAGITAIQLHHVIERTTRKLYLQAINEEIRHAIFKKGHTALGLSSAMDGMNIAIELKWLQQNLKNPKSNLQRRLLRQHIFIEYLEQAVVVSPKPQLSTHVISAKRVLSDFPEALLSANWDYADKLFQRLLPSWKTLLLATCILSVTTSCFAGMLSIKWWMLLFGLLLIVCFAIPDYLVEPKKKRKSKKD